MRGRPGGEGRGGAFDAVLSLCTTNLQDVEFVLHFSGGCLCKFCDGNALTDGGGGGDLAACGGGSVASGVSAVGFRWQSCGSPQSPHPGLLRGGASSPRACARGYYQTPCGLSVPAQRARRASGRSLGRKPVDSGSPASEPRQGRLRTLVAANGRAGRCPE